MARKLGYGVGNTNGARSFSGKSPVVEPEVDTLGPEFSVRLGPPHFRSRLGKPHFAERQGPPHFTAPKQSE